MGIVNKVSEQNAKCKEITDVLCVEIGFVTSGDRLLRFATCRVCFANIEFAPTYKKDMFVENHIKIRRGDHRSSARNNEILCNLRSLSCEQIPTNL